MLKMPLTPASISAFTTRAVSSRSTVSSARQSEALGFEGVGMIAHAPLISFGFNNSRIRSLLMWPVIQKTPSLPIASSHDCGQLLSDG
jgi:hypothetical protein